MKKLTKLSVALARLASPTVCVTIVAVVAMLVVALALAAIFLIAMRI